MDLDNPDTLDFEEPPCFMELRRKHRGKFTDEAVKQRVLRGTSLKGL